MSLATRSCRDGTQCENGSSCAEHSTEEGTYYCDCATSRIEHAGLYCEYEAETFCRLQSESLSDWFCTNDGTCVLSTNGGGGRGGDNKGGAEAQWMCDCNGNFDGPHCEFIRGTVPRTWPGNGSDPNTGVLAPSQTSKMNRFKNDDGIHASVTSIIVFIVLVVLALMSLLVVRSIRRGRDGDNSDLNGQHSTRDTCEVLKLEPDGSVLQEVMQSFSRMNHHYHHNNKATDDKFGAVGNRSSNDQSVEVSTNDFGNRRFSDNPENSASVGII